MILVFGATGRTGNEVVTQLLARGARVRTLIRDSNKAVSLQAKGVEVIVGDAGDPDILTVAFKNIEKVYVLLANGENQLTQEKLITDKAKAAGVKLLVKQSSLESIASSTKPIPKIHVESEAYIKASGINWVMIRPTFFMQMLFTCSNSIKTTNNLVFPLANGCVAATDARDVAEVAAIVLTEQGHENKSYDISGAELLSFDTIGIILSCVLNRKINYVAQSLADYRAMLEKVIQDEWRINAVCEELDALAKGCVTHVEAANMQKLLGRPPRTIRQFIEDYAAAFTDN